MIGPNGNMVVMEGCAPKWCRLIGARQCIDTAPVRMGAIGPNAFRNQNAPADTGKITGMQTHSSTLVL